MKKYILFHHILFDILQLFFFRSGPSCSKVSQNGLDSKESDSLSSSESSSQCSTLCESDTDNNDEEDFPEIVSKSTNSNEAESSLLNSLLQQRSGRFSNTFAYSNLSVSLRLFTTVSSNFFQLPQTQACINLTILNLRTINVWIGMNTIT